MSEPLRDNDPRQLGAYRLSERLNARPEGVVYLAHDSAGAPVSVAMLSEGAAADPAARDRFTAAVTEGDGVEGPPRVLAANTSNPAACWVAAPHGGAGAGAYLDPVGVGSSGASGTTPGYAPYWAGAQAPASARWSWQGGRGRGATAAETSSNRGIVIGLVGLLLLIVALLVALYMWLAEVPPQAMPERPQPSPQESPQGVQGEEASPEESSGGRGGGEETVQPSPVESPTGDVPSVPLDGEDGAGEGLTENPEQIP
ncbi:hypothetical protein [Halostreptopolyspora alba]|uniref:Serine/threonine protein kinase n=1 Tax=Halostreptopolyspora alba TaxID=2487137 RepID=A0A3N0E219_9ACTN|nr:hypothetical protein EFW17_21215 [Nocardiopsaceae bacterium YIM 96095]